MKFLNLVFFTGYAAAISCSDNSNDWASCGNGKVKDYSYAIFINKSVSDLHTHIPVDILDFWTKNQVSSESYLNSLVHPDYMIKRSEATDIDWVYGITKQYNKNRVIDAQEWADNSNDWASCGNGKVKDYSYAIFINKSVSDLHTHIPVDILDFWTKNQVSSESYLNSLVHPDYMIKRSEATDIDWVYGITKQYNKNRVIDAQEWAGAIKDAYDAMNKYKTYQATLNTDFGSLVLQATPFATSRKCSCNRVRQEHASGSGGEHELMIVDPHISTNMSATYLEVYPKLAEALSVIEEYTTKYFQPSVNETAKTTAKIADSVLYNLQVSLANITKPIDLFIHQKLLKNPEITNENDNILFAHTIRVLLSDLATTISQLKIDTIYRKMNLTGKPPQISSPDTDPLFEPEPFQRHQQPTHQLYSGGGFAQAQLTQDVASTAPTKNPAPNITQRALLFVLVSSGKADKRPLGSRHCRKGIQDFVQDLNPEKPKALMRKNFISFRDMGAKLGSVINIYLQYNYIVKEETSIGSKQSADGESFCSISKESSRGGENKKLWILQQTEGLNVFAEFQRFMYAHSDSLVVQETPEVQLERKGKREMCGIHIKGTGETKKAGISDKLKEFSKYPSTNNYTFRNDNKFKEDEHKRLTPNSVKTDKSIKDILTWTSFRAQKQSTINIGYIEINSNPYRVCNTKLNVFKNPTKNTERAVISYRDT
ncbi:hypothetical protein BB561_005790 [Smittium simulii]|uniref:Uncharacterized protein n=1 Tax=Smittium simulii TaxID=133385 RepID=A0A2T9Y878_9FUNG|nr:hypothetical protein BB561_005790 [Smittium simulii]